MARKDTVKQATFVGGEISPELRSRTDLDFYWQSAALFRNWIVTQTGAAKNRPGTKLVREAKSSATRIRLVPFIYSSSQSYMLEFGDKYVRFHTLGGTVMTVVDTGTHTTGANAATLQDTAPSPAWVASAFIGGTVRNTTDGSSGIITANTTTTVTAQLTGGLENDWDVGDGYSIEMPYEVVTAWAAADLPLLKFDQLGDVLTITRQGYNPYELRRLGHTDWTIRYLPRPRPVSPPTSIVRGFAVLETGTHTGGNNSATMTDSTKVWTLGRWLGGLLKNTTDGSSGTITLSAANTLTATLAGGAENDWDTGDAYQIEAANAWDTPQPNLTPAERWDWVFTSVDATGNESLISVVHSESFAVLYPTANKPRFTWTAPTSGAVPVSYNVYRGRNGIYGFVGSTKSAEFIDDAHVPDYSDGPPTGTNPFLETIPAGNGTPRTATFSAGVAIKTQAAEAAAYKYTYFFLWVGSGASYPAAQLDFQARPSGGATPWTTYYSAVFSVAAGTFNLAQEITASGLAASSEFRIVKTTTLGTVDITPEKVIWVEDAAGQVATSLPACVGSFDQRRVFAGFSANPQAIKLSATGNIYDFDIKDSTQDDDALVFVLVSGRVDEIRWMVSQTALIAGTASAIWVIQGGSGDPLSATSFDLKPRTGEGASSVQAIVAGDVVIYVGERGRTLRGFLRQDLAETGIMLNLSARVEHLFRSYGFEELAWAGQPDGILWAIRADGVLLGLTYERQQQIMAWHQHTTGALHLDDFESVAVIPEGGESKVYVAVKRTIAGVTRRYVEMFTSRQEADVAGNMLFLDSAVAYDGRNTTAKQLKLQDGTLWTALESMTLHSDTAATFIAADVGSEFEVTVKHHATGTHTGSNNQALLTDSAGTWTVNQWVGGTVRNVTDGSSAVITANTATTITATLAGGSQNDWDTGDVWFLLMPTDIVTPVTTVTRFRVTAFIDGQNLTGYPLTNVPASNRLAYTSTWSHAFNTFRGLGHLEGQMVRALVDGAAHAAVLVTAGQITLGANIYAARIQVGLPIPEADLVTLPIDVPGDGGKLRGSSKVGSMLQLEMTEYSGLQVGEATDALQTISPAEVTAGLGPPGTYLATVRAPATFDRLVSLVMRQAEPLPATVLSVIVGPSVGGNT